MRHRPKKTDANLDAVIAAVCEAMKTSKVKVA
jgi:hypothetical protein